MRRAWRLWYFVVVGAIVMSWKNRAAGSPAEERRDDVGDVGTLLLNLEGGLP